jgi:ribonuclease R
VVDLYRAMLMRDRIGEEFQATITGITEHGVFAAIESPNVDVFCRLASLPPDQYQTDQYGTRLVGLASGTTYALFDRLTVRIDDVSIARRRISAVPVHVVGSQPPAQQRGGRGGGGGGKPKRRQQRQEPRGRSEREQRRHVKETRRGDRKAKRKKKR